MQAAQGEGDFDRFLLKHHMDMQKTKEYYTNKSALDKLIAYANRYYSVRGKDPSDRITEESVFKVSAHRSRVLGEISNMIGNNDDEYIAKKGKALDLYENHRLVNGKTVQEWAILIAKQRYQLIHHKELVIDEKQFAQSDWQWNHVFPEIEGMSEIGVANWIEKQLGTEVSEGKREGGFFSFLAEGNEAQLEKVLPEIEKYYVALAGADFHKSRLDYIQKELQKSDEGALSANERQAFEKEKALLENKDKEILKIAERLKDPKLSDGERRELQKNVYEYQKEITGVPDFTLASFRENQRVEIMVSAWLGSVGKEGLDAWRNASQWIVSSLSDTEVRQTLENYRHKVLLASGKSEEDIANQGGALVLNPEMAVSRLNAYEDIGFLSALARDYAAKKGYSAEQQRANLLHDLRMRMSLMNQKVFGQPLNVATMQSLLPEQFKLQKDIALSGKRAMSQRIQRVRLMGFGADGRGVRSGVCFGWVGKGKHQNRGLK